MFTHLVFFWLKPDAPADERQKLLDDCAALLSKIPSVRKITAGVPANTPRAVVDNSYDVGVCVIYDDLAGHDAYQTHPLHVEFGNRHKQYWAQVRVYDFH